MKNKSPKPNIAVPVSRGNTAKTPRRGVFNLTQTEKAAKLNGDYELNRNIFSPTKTERKENKSIKKSEKRVYDTDLIEIQELYNRIPQNIDNSLAFTLSPILDRILSTVASWPESFCQNIITDTIIGNLQERLFVLIEVDDFLLRVIVCRILMYFAKDPSSQLIEPISRIFFKLSADPSNFDFFVEEKLDSVLLSLLQTKSIEARLFSAGALRNVTKCTEFCDRLQPSFIDIVIPFFLDDSYEKENQLRQQLLRAVKHMCSSSSFRTEFISQHILQHLVYDSESLLFCVKLSTKIPSISSEDRIFLVSELMEVESVEVVLPFIPDLIKGIENCEICANFIVHLIQNTIEYPNIGQILEIAPNCCTNPKNVEIFEKSGQFVKILKDSNVEMGISLYCLKTVRFFGVAYDQIIQEAEERFGFLN